MRALPDTFPALSPATSDWRQSWLDGYACDMPSVIPYPRVSLSALLERAARLHPKHPACTLYGKATTYEDLDGQARRLARSLIDLGARPGRHVGLLLPNIPEYLAALQGKELFVQDCYAGADPQYRLPVRIVSESPRA